MGHVNEESPATRLINRLEIQFGHAQGLAVAEEIIAYVEAMQLDTIERIKERGRYDRDY